MQVPYLVLCESLGKRVSLPVLVKTKSEKAPADGATQSVFGNPVAHRTQGTVATATLSGPVEESASIKMAPRFALGDREPSAMNLLGILVPR